MFRTKRLKFKCVKKVEGNVNSVYKLDSEVVSLRENLLKLNLHSFVLDKGPFPTPFRSSTVLFVTVTKVTSRNRYARHHGEGIRQDPYSNP